jgi:hypothetical protein
MFKIGIACTVISHAIFSPFALSLACPELAEGSKSERAKNNLDGEASWQHVIFRWIVRLLRPRGRSHVLALALLACFPVHADEVAALLKKADSYRLPEAAARIETLVELYRNDALNKERSYTVYIKPGRRSLVLMKSPSELGQKVLMLADQFWLLMPDTQRPLRITATQKLLGEAATGDIASMSWSEDYTGQVVGEAPCPSRDASPQPSRCLHLDLNAARPGVTYARIELYLDKSDKLPIKADLYVNSGKRAKEAWFDAQPLDGRLRIVSMTLLDDIQAGRRTLVRYRKIEAKETPDEFFNPAALVRNSLAGW